MILIKSEPALQRRFNLLHESGIQNSNALFQLNSRNTSDPLRIERARLKSASLVGYLESGPAGVQRARDVRDHCPFVVEEINAQDETWSGPLCQTQVNYPD